MYILLLLMIVVQMNIYMYIFMYTYEHIMHLLLCMHDISINNHDDNKIIL